MDISKDFSVSVMEITAKQAADLLTRNKRNRTISDKAVNAYRNDMLSGRWTMTGEPIQFDSEGHLANGQHRLTAHATIDDPDFTLSYVVVTGLDPETQMDMDQGRRRTAGAQLAMLGHKNANFLAAAVKMIIAEEQGIFVKDFTKFTCSNSEVVDWVENNQDLVNETAPYFSMVVKTGGASAALAFFLKVWQVDPVGAKEFFHLLTSLEGLPKESPILALEFRLRRIREIRERALSRNTLGYFIIAWNAWKKGQPMKKMLTPKGGWTAANWPEIQY